MDNQPNDIQDSFDLENRSDDQSNKRSNERVRMSIENWKRKLLDLTKRNRALNFRMNKVSTIAIVDEQPPEVFRQLHIHERVMRFKAAPETEEQIGLLTEESALETGDVTQRSKEVDTPQMRNH